MTEAELRREFWRGFAWAFAVLSILLLVFAVGLFGQS